MHPYRTKAARSEPDHDAGGGAYDLWLGFAVLFVASVARVAGAFVHHETWGTEPTLALLLVLGGIYGSVVGVGRRLRRYRLRL
jgi:hypothetical protein